LVHISTQEAIQEILKARRSGVDVTVETCTHYLALTAEDVEAIGPRAKCQPPLRKKADQERLWDELIARNIDWITSDHSPCTEDLKQRKLYTAWGGISGCKNNVDLPFDVGLKQHRGPVDRFAGMIASTPAKRCNMTNKGEIAIGKDADIIFVDPNQSYTLKREDLYYKNKFSAYEDMKINARVTKTIVRGHVVFDLNDGIIGEPIG